MTTLVLNKAWQADRVVSWQDAMCLIVSGRAEVVEYYADKIIRTVTRVYNMPSVVRMFSGRIVPCSRVRLNRHNVWYRDGGRCQYCNQAVSKATMTYDHVLPRSRGGKTSWDNIVLSCSPCNRKKGDRTPEEANMTLRCKPNSPRKEQILRNSIQSTGQWKNWSK